MNLLLHAVHQRVAALHRRVAVAVERRREVDALTVHKERRDLAHLREVDVAVDPLDSSFGETEKGTYLRERMRRVTGEGPSPCTPGMGRRGCAHRRMSGRSAEVSRRLASGGSPGSDCSNASAATSLTSMYSPVSGSMSPSEPRSVTKHSVSTLLRSVVWTGSGGGGGGVPIGAVPSETGTPCAACEMSAHASGETAVSPDFASGSAVVACVIGAPAST